MPVARHTEDVEVTGIAQSRDGIHRARPNLGLFEVQGTKDNNVVLARHRDCPEIIGDRIEHTVSWKSGPDVGKPSGQPVRLRPELKGDNLYSLSWVHSQ